MMYRKIPYADCQQIFSRFELSDEAQEVVSDAMTPAEAIETLKKEKLYIDLTLFLCHSLPVREVLWWVCLSLELRDDVWTAEQKKAIQNARQWIREPDEAKRRLAENQTEKLKRDNAPGWLAQAIFWNGSGSISDVGGPVVMPPEFLYSQAAAGAINLAAAIPEWKGTEKYYQQVFAMALNIADGGNGQLTDEGVL